MNAAQRTFTSLMSLGVITVLFHTTALAQTNATNVAPAPKEENTERFHKGEIDLSPFGAYVDKAGGKWGGGAALTFYPFEKLGIGASTYWTDFKGTFFDNVEGEAYFRLPLLKIVAPYAVGGVGYQFDHDYAFETVGLGVDFRPFKHLDAFSDAQFRISNKRSESKNGAFIRLGVRFSF